MAAPKEPSPTISKPIAISAANTYTTTYANFSSSSQSNAYSNTYESQYHQAMPQLIRKQLAIEPRYSITESQPIVMSAPAPTAQEEKPQEQEEAPKPAPATVPEGKRMSRSSVSYQQNHQHQSLHTQNEHATQKARRSFAEAPQKPQKETESTVKRGSITQAQASSTRKESQVVEQQIRLQQQQQGDEQSSRRTSQTSQHEQRRGSIQERQSRFEQTQETAQVQQEQHHETSVLDKEVQDMVAPRIRIVEPRWRTPSRQYLNEFEAHSSSGQGQDHGHGEMFLSDPNENLRPTTPSSRPWTPSRAQHRTSHIPYYQEQLAWEEGVALSKEFEKKLRTPSPNPMMRPKSPAFGPPPNPLLLIHPQTRDEGKDLSGKYLSGTKLLSPMWEQQHYKNEYLGVDLDNPYYEKQHQSASQKYVETPETVQRQKIGDMQVETRSKGSHMEQQKKAEMERSTCEQVGDTQVQRRTRVVEEFEHSHSEKTMEIQKTKGATLTIQDEEFPPRGFVAQQARRLSVADSEGGSATNNVAKRQVGGGQEMRDFTVPTFRSQVSVQQQQQSSTQMQSYSAQSSSSTIQKSAQVSQSSFPSKSFLPPPGFPTSAEAPPQMAAMMLQQKLQQQQQLASSFSATNNFNNNIGATNKPPLPPATNPEQPSFNPNNNHYDPSPISSSNTNPSKKTSSDPVPGLGGISGKPYNVQNVTQPKRGRGILNQGVGPSGRSPLCGCCGGQVRWAFC